MIKKKNMFKFINEFGKDNPQSNKEELENEYIVWLEDSLTETIKTLIEVAQTLDEMDVNVDSTEFEMWRKCNKTLGKIYK